MNKISLGILVTLSLLVCMPSALRAVPPPPRGQQPYHLTTVSWILSTKDDINADDKYVTLIGRVTGREGDETYYFNDGTGMIRLDSEKFELPVGQKLVIGGRIDQAYLGFGHLEVDVRNWKFARH